MTGENFQLWQNVLNLFFEKMEDIMGINLFLIGFGLLVIGIIYGMIFHKVKSIVKGFLPVVILIFFGIILISKGTQINEKENIYACQ